MPFFGPCYGKLYCLCLSVCERIGYSCLGKAAYFSGLYSCGYGRRKDCRESHQSLYAVILGRSTALVGRNYCCRFQLLWNIFRSRNVYCGYDYRFCNGTSECFRKAVCKGNSWPDYYDDRKCNPGFLDFGTLLSNGFHHPDAWASLKKQLVTILGFLVGCFLGAYAGKQYGLVTLILPGLAMIICYFYHRKN